MKTGCARVHRTTIQHIIYTPKYTKFCTVINMYRIYSSAIVNQVNSRPLASRLLRCTVRCDPHINWKDNKMICECVLCALHGPRVEEPTIFAGNEIGRMFPSMCGRKLARPSASVRVPALFYCAHLYASESRWNIYYILKCTYTRRGWERDASTNQHPFDITSQL